MSPFSSSCFFFWSSSSSSAKVCIENNNTAPSVFAQGIVTDCHNFPSKKEKGTKSKKEGDENAFSSPPLLLREYIIRTNCEKGGIVVILSFREIKTFLSSPFLPPTPPFFDIGRRRKVCRFSSPPDAINSNESCLQGSLLFLAPCSMGVSPRIERGAPGYGARICSMHKNDEI